MRYKDQVQSKLESVQNLINTVNKGITDKSITPEHALDILNKIKRQCESISKFINLE